MTFYFFDIVHFEGKGGGFGKGASTITDLDLRVGGKLILACIMRFCLSPLRKKGKKAKKVSIGALSTGAAKISVACNQARRGIQNKIITARSLGILPNLVYLLDG